MDSVVDQEMPHSLVYYGQVALDHPQLWPSSLSYSSSSLSTMVINNGPLPL